MNRFALLAVVFIQISFIATINCTSRLVGGDSGGSEITNGKVVSFEGTTASGIVVSAYPENYITGFSSPFKVITTITASDGSFELAIDSGLYNVFIIDTANMSGRRISDVGPRTDLGTIRLDRLGAIEGTIRVDSTNSAPVLIVYVTGTPLRADISSSDGSFRFDNVPAGEYTVSIARMPVVGCKPGSDCAILPGTGGGTGVAPGVVVSPGVTAVIDTLVKAANIGTLP